MKNNISYTDRIIRMAIAMTLVVLCLGHFVQGTVGLVLLISGIVLLVTSFAGFCPIYWILGRRETKQNRQEYLKQ